jgi:hypothetical protein
VAGGEGFEPPTSGSGGLCPIQARLPAHRTHCTNSNYDLGTYSPNESEIADEKVGIPSRQTEFSSRTTSQSSFGAK